MTQISFFDTVKDEDILEEIKTLDLDRMTPMEALMTLNRLKSLINNRWH